ncbi:MAG: PhzF family phenazine biosynthesis isomerase [Conexibacter sp.]|nr:PhzF family phenazine biosynthesis isomerase [Conexibacter sp.]
MGSEVRHTVVFADGEGGGNPCPVVFGADDWSTERMRAAAAELGHETCFVLEPESGADVRLRYFVPNHEMEMCVHATVAATVLLAAEGRAPERVQTPLGVRRVWLEDGDRALVEQFPPELGAPVEDPSAVLAALGARPEDLAREIGPIQPVSTARAKLLVPLASEAALDALTPDFETLWALCDALGVTGLYPFTLDARGADAAARQFPLRAGYDEDPATGVAACGLGAYLAHHHQSADGWHRTTIAQGRAMGRPSLIEAHAYREDGRVTATRVGGAAAAAYAAAANRSDAPAPLAIPPSACSPARPIQPS